MIVRGERSATWLILFRFDCIKNSPFHNLEICVVSNVYFLNCLSYSRWKWEEGWNWGDLLTPRADTHVMVPMFLLHSIIEELQMRALGKCQRLCRVQVYTSSIIHL